MATYGVVVLCLTLMLTCISIGSAKVIRLEARPLKISMIHVFNYDSSHTVDEVTSGDYATCTVGNSIASYNSGTTTISLNTTGSHYFICGVMGHCGGGMKLTIDVAGDGSPSAAPTSSSIAADSPTTTPSGTAFSPPTVDGTSNIPVVNSSPTVSPVVAAGLGLVALMSELILG
ncbi:hypothetical protein R6Q59_009422 [Mikania micrantha]